jgi:hypothetical protein
MRRLALFGVPGRRLAEGEDDDPFMYLRVVGGKLDTAGSLNGRRWLAIPTRGGSVAKAPGFG